MFKLQPEPTFWAEVSVKTPSGPESFKMQFRHLSRLELEEWLNRVSSQQKVGQNEMIEAEVDAYMEVCKGWDIEGAEFSKDSMRLMVTNYLNAGVAIVRAFNAGLIGGSEKN